MKKSLAFIALIFLFAGCAGSAQNMKKYELHKAITENPRNAQAHYELGKIRFEESQYVRAIDHLEQAVQLNPTNLDAYALLVTAHNKMGNYGRVMKILKRPELANYPENSFALGTAYMGQSNMVGAKERLIKAMADKPELARVYNKAIGKKAPADSPPLSAMEQAMADVLERIQDDMRREILEDIKEDIRESMIQDK